MWLGFILTCLSVTVNTCDLIVVQKVFPTYESCQVFVQDRIQFEPNPIVLGTCAPMPGTPT